jgi:hypothetical protein
MVADQVISAYRQIDTSLSAAPSTTAVAAETIGPPASKALQKGESDWDIISLLSNDPHNRLDLQEIP